jgi:hypothetical protein
MTWTKQHSKNAVAAKARKRIDRATKEPERTPRRRVPVPRKGRAVITIQIRDHEIGDSLTLNLKRSCWRDAWYCEQGFYSTAQVAAAVKHIVHSAALRSPWARRVWQTRPTNDSTAGSANPPYPCT